MTSLRFKPGKVPLDVFELTLKLSENIELNLTKSSELAQIVKEPYSSEPNILLFDFTKQPIQMPLNGGLLFTDKTTGNSFFIGKKVFKFTFIQYSNWSTTLEIILPIMNKICKFFDITTFKNVTMTYVDKFEIPKTFIFNDYFMTKLTLDTFNLHWHDFHLGIVPEDDDKKKLVIRIRGREAHNDNFYYFIDSVYLGKKSISCSNGTIFMQELQTIHDLLEENFVKMISPKFAEELGMKKE